MKDKSQVLQTVFTKNRSEELGYDVWENFVIPPFFDLLDICEAKKSRMIVGGRGCGKTMLIRYLSHHSAFSPKRSLFPDGPICHIGLYWRADTHFIRAMTERGAPPDVWTSAFNHLLAIDLGMEVLQSIKNIVNSKAKAVDKDAVARLHFGKLSAYDPKFAVDLDGMIGVLEGKNAEFEMWVNNARTRGLIEALLPGERFLKSLISCVKAQLPQLNQATYFVYIDEYENLLEYQQKIINTLIKHSEPPLIFNVAMKRYGFRTLKTVGEESIVDIADYRTYDLDQLLTTDDFSVFAAEILFLHIALADFEPVPIDPETLRDPSLLDKRREKSYRQNVLERIRAIFPGLTHEELAMQVFEEPSLQRLLQDRIRRGLARRGSDLDVERFYRPNAPQASIVASALLNRRSLQPEEIAEEIDNLEKGLDNRFTGNTDWLHNNFVGCLLSLYKSHSHPCPFYAGFDTFCVLARGNLRHFLELCHRSMNQVLRRPYVSPLKVSPDDQASAARQASAKFLCEVRFFGSQGNRLHAFVLRLGSLLSLAHDQIAQSEPERSHFVIIRGTKHLSEADTDFLREAQKWSVLFEEEETKIKDPYQPANYEYVLNPIYAPYFHITYRKRRKLEIKCDDFLTLLNGSYDEVRDLLKRFSENWSVDLNEANPTLFSHLTGE